MSMLIKGVETPESCAKCFCCWHVSFEEREFYSCNAKQITFGVEDRDWIFKQRPTWCPGVEVPTPHGELIDRDAIIETYNLDKATKYGNKDAEQQAFSYSTMLMYEIADLIDNAPTVIEAEE